MRKAFLVTIAAITAAVTASSTIMVQAGTQNVSGSCRIKGYVISGNNAYCESGFNEILNNFKIDIESGKSDNCFTIIYPEIDIETSCTNNPETSIPETEEIITTTTAPETSTSQVIIPETSAPAVTVPETTKPSVEVSTTEAATNPAEDNQDKSYAEQVVDLVNKERAKAGLSALTLDKTIESAALVRAKEIEVSFSHTRPNGSSFSTVLSENGISYRGAGENIAWGQTSPEAVMEAWMNSEGHRANILNASFTKIGVGYYQNSAGRKFWTQLFTY